MNQGLARQFARLPRKSENNRNRVLVVQPPMVRPLGFSEARVGPAPSHGAAFLRESGYEVLLANLDADPNGMAPHPTWRALAQESNRLPSILASERFHSILDGVGSLVAAYQPDVAVVDSGDWCVPAKDVSDARIDLALGAHLRALGVPRVVAEGSHCTPTPAPFLEIYDAVITGIPGEALLAAVQGDKGLLPGMGLDPYLDLLPEISNVWPTKPDTSRVMSEFGCIYGRCEFCPSAIQYRGLCEAKPLEVFVADVARRRERTIHICDNCFGHDIARLRRVAPNLRGLRKDYVVDQRSDAADCPERLQLLRFMNTTAVKVGVESLSEPVLAAMRKGQTVAQVTARLRRFHEAGFAVYAYLLLGTEADTPGTMAETLDRAEELDFVRFLPNFYCRLGDIEASRAHHFSVLQAEHLGIPAEIIERALRLSARRGGWLPVEEKPRETSFRRVA